MISSLKCYLTSRVVLFHFNIETRLHNLVRRYCELETCMQTFHFITSSYTVLTKCRQSCGTEIWTMVIVKFFNCNFHNQYVFIFELLKWLRNRFFYSFLNQTCHNRRYIGSSIFLTSMKAFKIIITSSICYSTDLLDW